MHYAEMTFPCGGQMRKRRTIPTTSGSEHALACCTSWRVVLFHVAAWAIICMETNTEGVGLYG